MVSRQALFAAAAAVLALSAVLDGAPLRALAHLLRALGWWL